MDINKIVFFNFAHNGDIFASKEYVRQIVQSGEGLEFEYRHVNSSKLLKDLNIGFVSLDNTKFGPQHKFIADDYSKTLYINTWIGNYLNLYPGINWHTYIAMFKEIYDFLRNNNIMDIRAKTISNYIPEINFDYYDVNNISVPENSILISNGPSLSGQSNSQGFNEEVFMLLSETEYNIILTHNTGILNPRVFYTDNLISTTGGDLNEISYIAERCEFLIGRNSGPFCYMHTKNILNNPEKHLIAVGNREEDCFTYNMKLKCKYHFVNDSSAPPRDQILRILNDD